MGIENFPFLELFLGLLGMGLSILCCTSFCRACTRFREEQIEREVQRRSEHSPHLQSIYFIPFPRSRPQQDSEDQHGVECGEPHTPPRYSTTDYYGPPPSYNELGIKPDDLPPAYTEQNFPVYPTTPPPTFTNMEPLQAQLEVQSQP
ncbi:uncharacterized protein [Leuresthes tenuis]|uniref:uncharacterized protein n=1 Tax=Leuresthes tenuis TaxID=355514 RepID=UPI003B507E06